MALLDGRNLTAYEQQQELSGFFGFKNQIIWDRYKLIINVNYIHFY